ncbi:hypothetical protein OG21DRAFT_1490842 [Imleria badia]|nr:hypothetical protein OG21DRAFT_1490842 [Imleria badia]
MPPILPSGRYTISIARDTEKYYFGPLVDEPEKLGLLPGNVDPPPIFTLDNVDEVNEYNILIDERLVSDKDNGELLLERPELGVKKKWKIFQSVDDKDTVTYRIGEEEKVWCFAPQVADDFPITNIRHKRAPPAAGKPDGCQWRCGGSPPVCVALQITPCD